VGLQMRRIEEVKQESVISSALSLFEGRGGGMVVGTVGGDVCPG
jgi:hypothetical protein